MLESFGTVAKEERVKSVEHNILPNSCVLENLEPFPGYHGENLPTDQGPDSFFLITTEEHSSEKIFRVSDDIRTFTGYSFNGSPARICLGNDTYHAIRIRDLNSYEPLEEIQKCYLDTGIRFFKKKNIDDFALIELKKIFSLEWISDNILKDKDGAVHYLKLFKQLTWGRFRNITRFVKNNLVDANFDAALVVIYANVVHDLVRIYDKNNNIAHLEEIRIKYIEGIKRTE